MNTQSTMPAVATLVPHSGNMILLDRILSIDSDNLCAEVCITPNSMFASEAGVGTWVGIEYMAQAVAAWAGHQARARGEAVKIGFLLGARRYEAFCPYFEPGSVLHIRVTRALQGENGLGAFECKILENELLLAKATVTVFQPPNVDEFLQEIAANGEK
jgi:predicted hotdog family 3-hydroxylacyl-ACP dehydratase